MIKFFLWAIMLGSVVMGYLGYKTGSATNAVTGVGIMILAGFTLFFLLKLFLHFGFWVVKILLIFALIAIIAVSGLKGCQYLTNQGRKVNQTQVEQVQSFETEVAGKNMWERAIAFFSLSKLGWDKGGQPIKQQAESKEAPAVSPLPEKISGIVTDVRSGYLFKIGNHFVKLYGVDAPDPGQTCLNVRGESFNCGNTSKIMLEKLAEGKKTKCKVVGGDYKGNFIATCKIRSFDIGASMVTAGWAVADRKASDVYIPYEEEAHKKKSGLWGGKFVAPWKARVKREQTSSSSQQKKQGFWENLF